MNAIQDDPQARELEQALILWLNVTGDLSVHLERQHAAGDAAGRRIVLELLRSRLGDAQAAAMDAFTASLFSPQ